MLGFLKRNYDTFFPTSVPKQPNALRFGILGAANIAPLALINPALSHPGVIIEAVAARDLNKAKAFAKKHKIPRTFGSYQELLDDPTIDVVYNPLPNGLHYEWTIKALNAGKQVLLEKPATNTAADARRIFALAKEKNLIVMEAFHYRFHPCMQKIKEIVDSGTIGRPKNVEVKMRFGNGFAKEGDIRRNYDVGGGAVMDAGGYAVNASRYLFASEPIKASDIRIDTFPEDARVDSVGIFTFSFPSGPSPGSGPAAEGSSKIEINYTVPLLLGFKPSMPTLSFLVVGEKGTVYCNNFMAPSVYHTIKITRGGDAKDEIVQAYTFGGESGRKGAAWWTTYRYMLEAFVDRLQGREPQHWITPEDTVANMEALELFYETSGLGVRPASTYEA